MERMDFKSFCNAVVNGIAEYLLQYEIESIRMETVCHNNGVEHVGLVILLQGDYVSPTIYLEQYYQYMVRQQASLSDVLELVAKEYRLVEDCLQKQEPLTVDLDQMQSRVFLRLVNYERNQETLANCPYIPFHDMAITFRYLVKMDEAGIASALIDYDSMEKSACTVEELYCMAKENTIRLFPPFLMRLDEFLRTRFPQEHVYPEEPEVYILSNRQFIYGATMLLYKDVVASFAEQMGKSVYIVPSSVNELLLCLTDAKKEKEMLENTLREVNEFVVPDTEFLSDAVYFYDKELGNIVV